MGFERYLDGVARQVEKRPKVIILLVILITIGSGYFLKDLTYETDMAAFFPENEVVAANDRLEDYFGRDDYIHIVEVSSIGGRNILSPRLLREQYEITLAAENATGVTGTQSVAGIVNELCHYIIPIGNSLSGTYVYRENKTILNTPDAEVQGRINILQDIMNGDIGPAQFTGGDVAIDPDAIIFSFGLLVSSDFDLDNFTASKSLVMVQLDGNYSRSELRDIVGGVKDEITLVDLSYVTEQETSEYYIAHEMESTIQPTMIILGIGIIAIITVILVGSFRHLSYVWAPMITLVVAIALTFATMTAMGVVLSILDVAVIPLIVGLGVDYAVHISRRYQEGLLSGKSIDESISISIRKVGSALFLAFATTVVAFMSNIVSDVPPIREFGIMCAIGITYAYVLAITFYPAIRIVVDRRRGGQASAPKPTPGIDKVMRRAANLVEERPAPIMALSLVLVVGSLFAATMVPVEFNIESFLPSDWESISTNADIKSDFDVGAYSTVYVLMEGDNLATPLFLTSVHTLATNMEDDSSVVGITDRVTGNTTYFTDSIGHMVKKAVEENASVSTAFNLDAEGLPTANCTDQDVEDLYSYLASNDDLYNGMEGLSYAEAFPTFMSYDNATSAYTASVAREYVLSVNDADNKIITDEAKANSEGFQGATVSLTGGVVLAQVVIDSLQVSQVESTIISTIFALLVLALIYRSFLLGVVSITPVIVAMSLSLGSMWLLGISLNALTIMITALTIGLGVDYAIHVVERFREEEAKHKPSKALHNTLENTGAALLISALTTIFGFGVLVIAGIPIFSDFGIVTAVMILYSLIAAAIVTPVILMWLARRKLRKGQTSGSSDEGSSDEAPSEVSPMEVSSDTTN